MAAFRLGITGGLASGKSSVARYLEERGCRVVDADRLVAELYRPGEAGTAAVRDLFGAAYVDDDGGVDRERLADKVFGDDLARHRLEQAVWPLVRRRFERIASNAGEEIVALEATLLVEAGFAPAFDLVVSVEAPEEVRVRRAVDRGMDEEEARSRVRAQGSGELRRATADVLIDNSASTRELEREVEGLLAEIRAGKFGERGEARRDDGGLPPFLLVTGNTHKVAEAQRILDRPVDAAPLDLPEIQSLDLVEVLRAKAAEAWSRLGRPVVVEESALELEALGGFPGPLVKWMLRAAGADGLARTALALGDDRATAHCALLYKSGPGEGDEVVAHGRVAGRLVHPPRGEGGFGWDPVFVPTPEGDAGGGRTAAELDGTEKDAVSHRGRAWRELVRTLLAAGGG